MTTRKKKPAERKASAILERNGACIRVDDVPESEAGIVLADMLKTFRLLRKQFPELTQELTPLGGGSIDYAEFKAK